MWKSERSKLQCVLLLVLLAVDHLLDLSSDFLEGVYVSLKLLDILGLCWFNHDTSGDWPRHGWGMESVVDESLSNILFFDSILFELVAIEDELVSNSSGLTSVKHLVVSVKSVSHVVRVKDGLDR